ncbi:MAG TPA: hypothetical protein DC084_04140 [Cupriavidus sp.]|nr:hypothetical protein [Cupriavidus sp.]
MALVGAWACDPDQRQVCQPIGLIEGGGNPGDVRPTGNLLSPTEVGYIPHPFELVRLPFRVNPMSGYMA